MNHRAVYIALRRPLKAVYYAVHLISPVYKLTYYRVYADAAGRPFAAE